MVHKNYKWNISKKKGEEIVKREITAILNEKINNESDIEEIHFMLNNRTKDIVVKNNNKRKNIVNFIKNVLGGTIYYLEQINEFVLNNRNGKIIITLQNKKLNINDWIFVDNDYDDL
jgi:hypothetical protein